MKDFFSLSEAADRCGVPPRIISDLLYARHLDPDRCPIVAGRRLIPRGYFPEVRRLVKQRARRLASV